MTKQKTAIVTGGARGIGRAISLMLATQGYQIAVNYRSSEKEAQSLVTEIRDMGNQAFAYACDVKEYDQTQSFVKETMATLGSVDILVNNAGITKDSLILRMEESDFDSVIDTNLKGTYNMTKHVIKPMLKNKWGRIINIASVIGLIGNAGQANYAASKAGIIGFTKSTAKELATRNITVNAIAPGFIASDMTDSLNEKQVQDIQNNIPMKALGQPEDVAHAVAFLAGEQARYITGQVLNVDGGMVV
ncbi:MAG TPA: beta-ketoacyl-ACP reductase [Eubacteriaceae bacterium]|nr:beta-ketoacyl-ACP reductase [Eubacteriaceae bacterium]